MKVRLSSESIYYLAEAFVKQLKADVNELNTGSIALDEKFEDKANALIKKLVCAKQINNGFVKAKKENEEAFK